MIKVWVCILMTLADGTGSSYSPASTVVDNVARVQDCHRLGKIWKEAMGVYATYRCVEVYKAK